MAQPSTSQLTKQKPYLQKFKVEWLENAKFKGWLKEHTGNKYLCRCIACGVDLKCGKSDLEKHAATEKHKKNVVKVKNVRSVNMFFSNKTPHILNVRKAEIKLSNFFAHHNVAFQVIDHLVPILQDCFSDSSVAKDMQLGRTKVTDIIKNVIAAKCTNDLANNLQRKYFSILIDETTDISVNKLLCVIVKFVDNCGKVCDNLLELITVSATNTDAEYLFASFKRCLETKNIPIKNIIGFASDNANVMIGKHNSFMTRLQSETNALIVIPCICHSSALVASNACSKLPRTPEEFVRSVANYFSVSAKRTAELAEMQEFFNVQQNKMLKLSATRWLSMQHAVKRVLDNWNILYEYFQVAHVEENSKVATFIFEELNNCCTKAILLFLNYILNFFNTFNALFQGKKLLVHEIATECKKIFKFILLHFVKPEYISDFKINCKNPRYFLDLTSIDLGSECNSYLLNLPEDIQTSIRKSCLEFLITAATDIQARFPLTDIFFDSLKFLNPNIALDLNKPHNLTSLKTVWSKFLLIDGIDGPQIDLEWKKIAIHFSDEKNVLLTKTVEEFWFDVGNYKNFNDSYEFCNIGKLANLCMSLPHSNAETERVFSVVSDVKTEKRNKIGSEALNAVSVIRFSNKDCCQSFDVTAEYNKLMQSNNLYK